MTRGVSDKDSGGGTTIQTKPLADIEAVVFDLDGTLCYYPLSVEEVFLEAFRRAGITPETLGDLAELAARYAELWSEVRATVQSTAQIRLKIIERLCHERGAEGLEYAARLSDAYGAVRDESGVRPFDDVGALLSDLRERYKLGLLTNGPSDIQWEKIRSLGFGDVFDAIVVAGDVGIYKPDVRVFEALLHRLQVRAATALFVGDAYEMDIIGAHRAGMRTAWIRNGEAASGGNAVPNLEVNNATALRGLLL